MPEQQVPQLRLGFHAFDTLAVPVVPDGYEQRSFRPGDEDAWLALLQSGDFGVWDRARLDRLLGGPREAMPYEGITFATKDDVPVAVVTCFFYAHDDPPAAEIGWVVVAPTHRGRGLGRAVCTAALRFIHDRQYKYAFLKTEDYRAEAIRLYLSLGFEPELVAPEHQGWWATFLAAAHC
jgi:ribosomal protein S18 acetylase RimI-like enzyme